MRRPSLAGGTVVTRRSFILFAAALPGAFIRPAAAQDAQLTQAAAFIRASGNRLANISVGATSATEEQTRLLAFLDDVVDFDSVARFSLGRYWNLATPQQQQEYVTAFRQVVMRNVTNRLGDYTHGIAKFEIGQPTRQGDAINVPMMVQQPGTRPLHLVWVVAMDTGRPRIVDLIAEGMSLRVTQRSDYAAFIARNHNDVGALIAAIQKQQTLPEPTGK
jgi:phospholipid transport system substrate-binding protein